MLKVAILSCGRSDFSILLPLITEMFNAKEFEVTLICYSSHLSKTHGYTISDVKRHFDGKIVEIETLVSDQSTHETSASLADTTRKFSDYWANNDYDWIVALGDRFEIFAAVSASVPFNIKIAHLHGGEKTLGADDNKYRHAISSFSTLHFTSCYEHSVRVQQIIEDEEADNVFNVGSLALNNINFQQIKSIEEFEVEFGIDLNKKTVLVTIHPETIKKSNDILNIDLLEQFISNHDFQYLITLPNNDAGSEFIRNKLESFEEKYPNVLTREFLGVSGYYTAMKHCYFIFGNSSSAIIESASFKKFAFNIGDRQLGRERNSNIFDVNDLDQLNNALSLILKSPVYSEPNKFQKPSTIEMVIDIIKDFKN